MEKNNTRLKPIKIKGIPDGDAFDLMDETGTKIMHKVAFYNTKSGEKMMSYASIIPFKGATNELLLETYNKAIKNK